MSRAPYLSFKVQASEGRARPVASDVVRAVVEEIRAGRMPAGSRLPPVRVLERTLGMSKNTAHAAYDELVARGVIETREREGVFVSAAAPNRPGPSPAPDAPRLNFVPPPVLTVRPKPGAIALSTVFIDPELLPSERLAECTRSVLKQPGLAAFYDAQGYPPLREEIAKRLAKRGINVGPDQVVITTGSQQAIDIVARATARRSVALENPVYPHARACFQSFGFEVTPLDFDPFGGIPLEAWAQAIARDRPSLLYAITSFQNPTGYSYSTHELLTILEIAREHGVGLVEDDWGSDMLSDSEYRPMLRLLGGENVVYINSFTKKLLPSLRLGFLVAAEEAIPSLVAMKRLGTLGNAWLTEAVLAEFLSRGYYDAHLTQLQQALDERYASCVDVLESVMPEGTRWTLPAGGPTLWLEPSPAVDVQKLRESVAARGVDLEPSASAFVGTPSLRGFRVSYAFHPEERLRTALTILAEELRRLG